MSEQKDSELTVDKFVGHRVRIHFKQPAETDGTSHKVYDVEAEFAEYRPEVSFRLRDITAAHDKSGKDIAKEAGLLGNGMVGHPFNIMVIESPKPVV